MDERKFLELTSGEGYTPAQIALLRKVHSLDFNKHDLPKDEAERRRIYEEVIGRFNQARRKLDGPRG